MHKLARLDKSDSKEKFERLQRSIKRFEFHFNDSLWNHQNSAMGAVRLFLKKSLDRVGSGSTTSGAIVMPTGSGKTALGVEIIKALGLRAMILAPTVKIAYQHYEELKERAPEVKCSLYYSDEKDLDGQVVVTTYASAVSLFKSKKIPEDIDVVFFDEAHRSLSPERAKLHGKVGLIEIGLTATPGFDEEKHIWKVFDDNIYEMDLQEAAELGIISPLRGFIVETDLDLTNIRLKVGERFLNEKMAEKVMNVIARNKTARNFYLDGFAGVPAVAFCITQSHAEDFARYLTESNVRATFVHAGLSNKERERRIGMFEDGSVDVITSRDVLIEGWDSNRATLALNLRPTYSRVVKTHMVGRVLRAREGKEAGIFAEFQDVYGKGQQPILVHHLLDQVEYMQGGLIVAPQKKRNEEREKLRSKTKVEVYGNLQVSFDVREIVALEETKLDFTDRIVVRKILESREDIDYTGITFSEFQKLRFDYPGFHGSGMSLMHKAWGMYSSKMGSSRGWLMRTSEDFSNFLWYALEDKMARTDSRICSRNEVYGLSFGEGEHLFSPEKVLKDLELAKRIKHACLSLSYRQRKILTDIFFEGREVKDIAREHEISRSRISEIKKKALSILKRYQFGILKSYLRDDEISEDIVEKMKATVLSSFTRFDIREQALKFLLRTKQSLAIYQIISEENISADLKDEICEYIQNNSELLTRALFDYRIPEQIRNKFQRDNPHYMDYLFSFIEDKSIPLVVREIGADMAIQKTKNLALLAEIINKSKIVDVKLSAMERMVPLISQDKTEFLASHPQGKYKIAHDQWQSGKHTSLNWTKESVSAFYKICKLQSAPLSLKLQARKLFSEYFAIFMRKGIFCKIDIQCKFEAETVKRAIEELTNEEIENFKMNPEFPREFKWYFKDIVQGLNQ